MHTFGDSNFLPRQSMGCDASFLGGSTSFLSTAVVRHRKRTTRCELAGHWCFGEPRDRRWYNPKRHRPLTYRRWVEAENSSDLLESGEDRFMLISYNILGVNNSMEHPDLYINVPFDAIQWESRKRLVSEDIRRWNADIVCLQEVDRYYDIENKLKKDGYVGRFKRRTGVAKDGCAIFWKNERFNLLEGNEIEFKDLDLRDNVAQLFVFEVRVFLQQAHALSEKWGGIPIVLAGDFNSTPESAIYEFLSTSELDITRHDRKFLSGLEPNLHIFSGLINHCWTDEELKNATGHSSCKLLTQPLKLQSSYAHINRTGRTRGSCGEPLATTYHSKFMGTVDYLWFSGELEPARVLDTLPISTLKSIGGLPSRNIGSDHLPLASEFVFISKSTQLKSQGQGKNKKPRKDSSS
ncbi:carbon catabolite repressor protein 4 homolog 3-like isoform X2 [Phalaenopsis equestris]|uniref:carbon catabolite repressor protein 4 homolog 3-like isoform X2 n=1 Tax=Phalaenopsis equestris TaxID=78828 RepID=UPI0009E4B521|nr:carbon catabolite repressor protein 4 homolog 3-like isoform X2 [Phalaenopsis equestris]